ncbi:MAG: 2,3-bisphosphoglycerate-independent phosphoglycerate mutase [Saprospiraceae bacterium]
MDYQKVILLILDGWGHGPNPKVSAIAQANTPFVDSLYKNYPNSELVTFGEQVGLPDGQMGNSEVGHLNIGAGRVVYQELARINKAIKERALHTNKTLLEALSHAKTHSKNVHFIGLLSDGGVHSHINHIKALCDIADEQGVPNAYVHVFSDGRDTDPKGGLGYIKDLEKHIEGKNSEVVSVVGRYYAMDRDKRWERVKLAYDLLVKGTGTGTTSITDAVKAAYASGKTDEFIEPIIKMDNEGAPITTIQEGDVVICYNFRTDRPREITEVLTQTDMPEYDMKALPLHYVTMTRYNEAYKNMHVLFEKKDITETIGEVLAKAGKTQLRIAETEKYPHVTFFFNGGREAAFENEERIIVPSAKVATYDLQPEMSAQGITDAVINSIETNQPDFICLNYANADMVGHTGIFEAAVKAVEKVDSCLVELSKTLQKHNYAAIVIADHGNSDTMINPDGSPNTAHTTNLVPCFFVANDVEGLALKDGKLGDIAPTILKIMGVDIPTAMDGAIILSKK